MTTGSMSELAQKGLKLISEKAKRGLNYNKLTDLPQPVTKAMVLAICKHLDALTPIHAIWLAEQQGLITAYTPAPGKPQPPIGRLSHLEKEVIIHLADGLTAREVAEQLGENMTTQGIDNIMGAARRKIGANNRLQLVHMVRRHLP